MQGLESALRPYAITNPGSSVGFFANRNHYAALLYSAVPFAAAWALALAADRTRRLGAVTCGLTIAALLLGLAMAWSRAGIALGLFGLILSILCFDGVWTRKSRLCVLLAIGLTGLIGLFLALPGVLGRFETAAVDDYRLDILDITLSAAKSFLPVGSGFATFQAIYAMHDRPDALLPAYVNHAHNDWAELWLEGGLPFALAAAGFLLWFTAASRADWGGVPRPGLDRSLRRAGAIAVCLMLLHSLVDYPLRTVSLLGLFAYCCALQVPPCRRDR
jgi:O-antigen ligase